MFDPEIADTPVGVAEGQVVVRFLVGKEGRVEIEPDPLRLRPVDPGREMAILDLVAVGRLVAVEVEGMQVEPVGPGDVGICELEVGAQLVGGAGATGVVAGGLDAAAGCAGFGLEPHHIVALPAVDRDRDSREPGDGGLCVDAPIGEYIPRNVVGSVGHSSLHLRALCPITCVPGHRGRRLSRLSSATEAVPIRRMSRVTSSLRSSSMRSTPACPAAASGNR